MGKRTAVPMTVIVTLTLTTMVSGQVMVNGHITRLSALYWAQVQSVQWHIARANFERQRAYLREIGRLWRPIVMPWGWVRCECGGRARVYGRSRRGNPLGKCLSCGLEFEAVRS